MFNRSPTSGKSDAFGMSESLDKATANLCNRCLIRWALCKSLQKLTSSARILLTIIALACAMPSTSFTSAKELDKKVLKWGTSSNFHHDLYARAIKSKPPGFEPLTLAQEPFDIVVLPGQPGVFHCALRDSSGSSPSSGQITHWLKDGSLLRGRKTRVLSNGTLIVGQAGKANQGFYQCSVRVQEGTILSRKGRLRLAVLKPFDAEPISKTVAEGDTASFRCKAEALPEASTIWYKDGTLISPAQSAGISTFPENLSGTLELRNVSKKDEGTYRCKVENVHGHKSSREGTLTVRSRGKSKKKPSAPVFVIAPESAMVTTGKSALLECSSNGVPSPEIVWLKGGEILKTDKMSRLSIIGQGSLFIKDVESADEGQYTCRASNTADSTDKTVTLEVLVAPRVDKALVSQSVTEANNVEFKCSVSGHPKPSIVWLKDGEVLRPNQYFQMSPDGQLFISGLVLSDSGIYQCFAENSAGSAQAFAILRVERSAVPRATSSSHEKVAVPGEPLDPKALFVASRYARMTWREPVLNGGGPVLYYSVYYKQATSSRERSMNSTKTEAMLTGLKPGSEYRVRIVASSQHGSGPSSKSVVLETKPEKSVPGKVDNLRGTAVSSREIHVQWDPPSAEDGGNTVDYYKLIYGQVGDTKSKSVEEDFWLSAQDETEVQLESRNYVLPDLLPYTTYSFRVEAHNYNGFGFTSDLINVTTLTEAPGASPLNVSIQVDTSKSLTVFWKPPKRRDRNGPLSGYKIKYRIKSRGSPVQTITTDKNARRFTITGLVPETPYVVKVAAVNENGTGPYTNWVSTVTYRKDLDESQIPPNPVNMAVRPRSNSVLVTWDPPDDPRIMIRGFTVGWGPGVPDIHTQNVLRADRQYVIEDLDSNRDYVISLKAFNNIGPGFPVFETVRTLEAGAEETAEESLLPPLGLRATTLSAREILLTWTNPNDQRYMSGGKKNYTIRFKSHYLSVNDYRYLSTSQDHFRVTSLRPNTKYEFSVSLRVGHRVSGWSMSAPNQTFVAAPGSAPRDVTVVRQSSDPTSVMLNWQPPKDAYGPITGYLIFYTDNLDKPDDSWHIEGVLGDRMSTTIGNLVPGSQYFFKMQARNDEGFGPKSNVAPYKVPKDVPAKMDRESMNPDSDLFPLGEGQVVEGYLGDEQAGTNVNSRTSGASSKGSDPDRISNRMLLIVGGGALAMLSLIVIAVVVGIFLCRSQRSKRRSDGYIAGVKNNQRPGGLKKEPKNGAPDLWIHQEEHMELKNLAATLDPNSNYGLSVGTTVVDSIQDYKFRSETPGDDHPRYESTLGPSGGNKPLGGATLDRRVGRAKPIIMSINPNNGARVAVSPGMHNDTMSESDSLNRSFHQNLQACPAGMSPVAQSTLSKVPIYPPTSLQQCRCSPYGGSSGLCSDRTASSVALGDQFGGSGSVHDTSLANQSTSTIPTPTPPPSLCSGQMSHHGPPVPAGMVSFTNVPPGAYEGVDSCSPLPPSSQIYVPSPRKPQGILMGSKLALRAPILTATYDSHQGKADAPHHPQYNGHPEADSKDVLKQGSLGIQPSHSTEELNNQIQSLDNLMQDLKAMASPTAANEYSPAPFIRR